jgi:hypothetical protein
LADTNASKTGDTGGREGISEEARKVLAATLILERANVHLERPRIRKELTDLIKNHVR